MQFLKGLCKCILGFLIGASMILIILSFSVKGLFSDIILKSSTIATKIASDELAENVKTGNEVIDEKVQELLKDKELKALVEKYIDKTLEGLVSEEALSDVNIEKDIIQFVQDHEDLIEEKLGVEIKEEYYEEAKNQEEYHEITNEYKKAIQSSREQMPDELKEVVKYFNFFLTMKCRLILFSILIISTILMALLQKSYFKWISTLAIFAISNGILLLVMSFAFDAIMNYIVKEVNGVSNFGTSVLTKNSLITLISGVIVLIIYKIVEKESKNKSKTVARKESSFKSSNHIKTIEEEKSEENKDSEEEDKSEENKDFEEEKNNEDLEHEDKEENIQKEEDII